jgi:hypothetical protein
MTSLFPRPSGLQISVDSSRVHSHSSRVTIVDLLLDWSDEARRLGRVQRAEYLLCLAWEAYDRLPR